MCSLIAKKLLDSLRPLLPFLGAATSCTSETHYAMVHQQLQPHEWHKIYKAAEAVNKEWTQLDVLKAWGYDSVCNYTDKCREADKSNKTFHFGRVFPLCHIKHSELPLEFRIHKGRVVFGSNQIRDETAFWQFSKSRAPVQAACTQPAIWWARRHTLRSKRFPAVLATGGSVASNLVYQCRCCSEGHAAAQSPNLRPPRKHVEQICIKPFSCMHSGIICWSIYAARLFEV